MFTSLTRGSQRLLALSSAQHALSELSPTLSALLLPYQKLTSSYGRLSAQQSTEVLRKEPSVRSAQRAFIHSSVIAAAAQADQLEDDVPEPEPLPTDLHASLQTLLGSRLSTNRTALASHGKDESYRPCIPPQAVVFPESTEEVSQVVRACAAARTPIIPYGSGTSLEGHIAAVSGGVCLDLSRMAQVLEVNGEDMDCRVQAGVTRKQLNDELRDSSLFFSVDPGADASIGGMAATRASGTNTVRYGTMRDNVLGLTAVMADGRVITTGKRVRKSSSGYDLTALLVGSEGTLGVITEVALRLRPRPEAVAAAVVEFGSMQEAVSSVVHIMQLGVPVARMEILDGASLQAVNAYSHTNFACAPTIFFEFHGSLVSLDDQIQAVQAVTHEHSGQQFKFAKEEEERTKLWTARHTAYWASLAMRPGSSGYPTDICVPISCLSESIEQAQKLCQEADLVAPMVGHVGDGNFHLLLLLDMSDGSELARAKRVVDQLVQLALSMGGTCTGEHGVGYGKLPFLEQEHGAAALDVMHSIKSSLDPLNILNPGKLGSPPASFCKH